MITVKQLKKELESFPDDALVYAYEGESAGIGILVAGEEGSFIPTDDDADKEAT